MAVASTEGSGARAVGRSAHLIPRLAVAAGALLLVVFLSVPQRDTDNTFLPSSESLPGDEQEHWQETSDWQPPQLAVAAAIPSPRTPAAASVAPVQPLPFPPLVPLWRSVDSTSDILDGNGIQPRPTCQYDRPKRGPFPGEPDIDAAFDILKPSFPRVDGDGAQRRIAKHIFRDWCKLRDNGGGRGNSRTGGSSSSGGSLRAQGLHTTQQQRAAIPLFVDVGGAEGELTLFAAASGCDTLTFEPQPREATYITCALRHNGFLNRSTLLARPVSDVEIALTQRFTGGQAAFVLIAANNGGAARPRPGAVHSVTSVRLDALLPAPPDGGREIATYVRQLASTGDGTNGITVTGSSAIVTSAEPSPTLYGKASLSDWPWWYIIPLLKIGVEGFELNVMKSARRAIESGLILVAVAEYTPQWPERQQWDTVLPWIHTLRSPLSPGEPPRIYVLHRKGRACYGPIVEAEFGKFHRAHVRSQTDILIVFDPSFNPECTQWFPDIEMAPE